MLTGVLSTPPLWDATTGSQVRTFSGHTANVMSVVFSPDGKYVLTGSADKTARLWDAATGRQVRTFVGHTGWIVSVAFSPDGKYVLTGSADGTARLWDTDYQGTMAYACSRLTRDLAQDERTKYQIADSTPTCP